MRERECKKERLNAREREIARKRVQEREANCEREKEKGRKEFEREPFKFLHF